MHLKRIYDMVIRPWPPIRDVGALADFIDAQAAFVSQKGIYEYSRARAGHYSKVLFAEQDFITAVDRARWQAFPLGLAMVTELVEGVLRSHASARSQEQLHVLRTVALSVFDRYAVPATLGEAGWHKARNNLLQRLDGIGLHAPKLAKDIPEPFAASYFTLMPIHRKLKQSDTPAIANYLKVTMCNIHDELTGRIDARAMSEQLLAHAH